VNQKEKATPIIRIGFLSSLVTGLNFHDFKLIEEACMSLLLEQLIIGLKSL